MAIKDFLQLKGVDEATLTALLDRAKEFKALMQRGTPPKDILTGKTVVNMFFENSTRTRCSFEAAGKNLGAEVISMSVAGSSVQKGENLIDTAITLDKLMPSAIVIRHAVAGSAKMVADHVNASVINAGDGMHAHPTQALLDMFTMREIFGSLQGLSVAIVGDIKHSRVARSNIEGLATMGAKVKVYGPATLMPKDMGKLCKVCSSIEEAFVGSDVVMGLRIQLERQQKGLFPSAGEYNKFYGINLERMKLANKGAVVMHPGPVNRGIELSHDVLDSPICVKDEQVTNGMVTRMALLEMLCKE